MTREFPEFGEKLLHWMGSSKKDLRAIPSEVSAHFGMALGAAQNGRKHPDAKPWKGDGPGVFEVVEDHRSGTYRAVFTVRFDRAVYALHVFQKKSKQGIKTPQLDRVLIAQRLTMAKLHYEDTYGSRKSEI